MSQNDKLDTILNNSKYLSEENNLAILGPSGVGKTVFLTLLANAMDHYFLDKYPDLKAYPKDGRPFLEECENSMLEGQFPERTQPLSRKQITFVMKGSGGTASSLEVKIPDISGEDYENMCLGEEIKGRDRVLKVFEMGKAKGSTHGHMSYAVYAKAYAILLDCSKIKDWEKMSTRYSQALTTIRDFKNEAKQSRNGNINSPIAIILTKADRLDNRSENAEEIVKHHMRRFYNTLDAIHDGKREFFKVFIDVQRNQDNEIDESDGLKVATPFHYSHDEYVRFLWWLHQNILD